jgi:hypothetical protein
MSDTAASNIVRGLAVAIGALLWVKVHWSFGLLVMIVGFGITLVMKWLDGLDK